MPTGVRHVSLSKNENLQRTRNFADPIKDWRWGQIRTPDDDDGVLRALGLMLTNIYTNIRLDGISSDSLEIYPSVVKGDTKLIS